MRQTSTKYTSIVMRALVVALLLCGVGLLPIRQAYADQVLERQLLLDNAKPGQTSSYQVSFIVPSAAPLGSILIEFCANTALFEVTCNAPGGFDLSTALLVSQSGEVGFTIDPSSTSNRMILTRLPAASAGNVQVTYKFDPVQNATAMGSQYARYSTYPTTDATGPETDRGAVAYNLNPDFGVSAEVPPYLEFCVGTTIQSVNCSDVVGNYLSLGDFSIDEASSGQIQMVVATNAGSGYGIRVNGNTLASGNNTLLPMASPAPSAPGNSQFGINLRANSNPSDGQNPSGPGSGNPAPDYNIPNRYTFRPGDLIAASNTVEDYRKYTVTYLVNISTNQPAGVYAGTYSYVAVGNF